MATIRYMVNDVDESLAFYTGLLGFEFIARPGPPMAMVGSDGLTLWLAGPGASARKPMPDGRTPEPGGWNRLVIETDDLVGLVEKLRAAKATSRNEILSGPVGKQILVEDPSGNSIELFQAAG